MKTKQIKLADGREVTAEIVSSLDADFESLIWRFKLCGTERVAGGDYYVIHCMDMEGRSEMGKPADEVKP